MTLTLYCFYFYRVAVCSSLLFFEQCIIASNAYAVVYTVLELQRVPKVVLWSSYMLFRIGMQEVHTPITSSHFTLARHVTAPMKTSILAKFEHRIVATWVEAGPLSMTNTGIARDN